MIYNINIEKTLCIVPETLEKHYLPERLETLYNIKIGKTLYNILVYIGKTIYKSLIIRTSEKTYIKNIIESLYVGR
jgi:hypothetical protein